jgi:uncharacterized membrane protein YqhA
MSNFAKDLREYTDDELYKDINRLDPKYMTLLSDELTRRSTDRWSQKLVDLTILLFFLGFLQLFISLKSISRSWVEWFFLAVLASFAILYAIRLVKNRKSKK